MALTIGHVLTDRYEIRRVVKKGGMGAVYQAYDRRLEGLCAVKEMLESVRVEDDEWVSRRFREEATLLSHLNHPDVPRVRDFFQVDGLSYIVMDFIEGPSLDQEKGLSPERVAADAAVVLDILTYLHELNPPVLHRDVKPANMIREAGSGRVKLVDFGLARAPDEGTQTSAGTMFYCAPEQLQGKAVPRSDLYSLAASLYELLSGQVPPVGFFEPLRSLVPTVPAHLAQTIEKTLSPNPRDRPASAREMLAMLAGEKPVEPPRSWPVSLLAVGGAALVLLGILAIPRLTSQHASSSKEFEPATLVNTTARPTLFLRRVIRVDEVKPVFGEMATRLYARAGELKVTPGPGYTRYHVWEPPKVDMEVGLVLPSPVPEGGELPAGQAARLVFHGGYDHLPEAYVRLDAWVSGQKLTGAPGPWALYVDTNPDHYTTELYRIIDPPRP